jgi:hypothetical protein
MTEPAVQVNVNKVRESGLLLLYFLIQRAWLLYSHLIMLPQLLETSAGE